MKRSPVINSVLPLTLSFFVIKNATANTIDGILDEDHWNLAKNHTEFFITSPYSLSIPDTITNTSIVATENGLFIGFINYQDLNDSTVRTSLRDEDILGDFNEVIIDFDSSGVRAFGFKVGRSGAVQDAVWTNENQEDTDWDGNWQHASFEGDDYWSTEIFIPWDAIAMNNKFDREINIYLSRWHQARNMRYSHTRTDRSRQSFISSFTPMAVVTPGFSQLDFFPYVSSSRDMVLEETDAKLGVDIFWKPSSNHQINAALNPDFGQVESDELVVNFSAIETFFSEKRPFFIENHDLLDIRGPESLRLVHTPRIGAESDNEEEEATDILGAVRYTQVGDSINSSILVAQEDDTKQSTGRDYIAARSQWNADSFVLGLAYTNVDRPSLQRQSDVIALDAELEPLDNLRLTGVWLYSDIDDNIDGDSTDSGWWIISEFEPSDEWSHELTLFHYGDQLQLNDFGFVRRVDRDQLEYEVSHEWSELNHTYFRDAEWGFGIEYGTNRLNQDLPTQFETQLQSTANTGSSWAFELAYITNGIDDLFTRGNNPVEIPSAYEMGIEFKSEFPDRFQLATEFKFGDMGLSGRFYEIELVPSYQFGDGLHIEFGVSYTDSDSWLVWIEDNDLGEYKQQEIAYEFNLSWLFWEKHEIRWKAESVALQADLINQYSAAANGDLFITTNDAETFAVDEFAMQIRYRYELGPLSEIFLVYGRGGEFEAEDVNISITDKLFNPVTSKDTETFFFKMKLHF